MSDDTQKKLVFISIVAVAVFIVFIWPHKYSWDGPGSVNLFPTNDSSKNYRLNADIEVKRYKNGWFASRDEYSIDTINWPNGGYLEFDDCTVLQDTRTSCVDQSGTEYFVEVESYPEQPEDDYSGAD